MIRPQEALDLVQRFAMPRRSAVVPLPRAVGRVLAEPVYADRDYPAFRRAMMDGYAVRLVNAAQTVCCHGEVAAGHAPSMSVTPGNCVEIMTGAPCPAGTEAVVQKEQVQRCGTSVKLPRQIVSGQHIASTGSECRRGAQVLSPGDTITPIAVAVLATFGRDVVKVVGQPSVAVLTTGTELVPRGRELMTGQIYDSNGPMLSAATAQLGLHVMRSHAADTRADILSELERATDHDLVLISGGVSAGNYDLVPDAVEAAGAEIVYHKVRQKPGKPLLFARRGDQLIFGLPGNPLACHFCFHRYVATAIGQMQGIPGLVVTEAGRLCQCVPQKAGRTHFVPARATRLYDGAGWCLEPLPGVSSADIFGACRANCYVEIPPGPGELSEGGLANFVRHETGTEAKSSPEHGAERNCIQPCHPIQSCQEGDATDSWRSTVNAQEQF